MRFSPLEASRWSLLAALVFAPWAFGSTRPWAKDVLAWTLIGISVLFTVGLVVRRRFPRIPIPVLILTAAILLQGWGMTFNARQVFDEASFSFSVIDQSSAEFPGTVDQAWSARAMFMITGLLGVLWVVCDLASHAIWRIRLARTIALTGVSIILLGLLQFSTGANDIFWVGAGEKVGTFFATYRYHANAGAFINLVLPFIAMFTVFSFRNQTGGRTFWALALVLAGASAFVNVSRGAMAITVILLVAVGIWQFASWRRRSGVLAISSWMVPVAAVVVIGAAGWAFGLDQSYKKWARGGVGDILENQRLIVYDTVWKEMLPSAGNWGLGPGTFQITFPFFTQDVYKQIPGIWRYAHQDYLQTLVEWGWIGSLAWLLLFIGGLAMAIWRLAKNGSKLPFETRALLLMCIFSLVGVLLHAMGDFPLQIASLRLYAVCMLGICWSLGGLPKPIRKETTGPGYGDEPPLRSTRNPAASLLWAVPAIVLLAGCAATQDPFLGEARDHLNARQRGAVRSYAEQKQSERGAAADRLLLQQQIEAELPNFQDKPDVVPATAPKQKTNP